MNRQKCTIYSKYAKTVPIFLEALVESIDRRTEEAKQEGEEANDDVMQKHCVAIAADGSRTFSF